MATVTSLMPCYVYSLTTDVLEFMGSKFENFQLNFDKGCVWHIDSAKVLLSDLPKQMKKVVDDKKARDIEVRREIKELMSNLK